MELKNGYKLIYEKTGADGRRNLYGSKTGRPADEDKVVTVATEDEIVLGQSLGGTVSAVTKEPGDMGGVAFENDPSVQIASTGTETSVDGVTTVSYSVSGTAGTMTAEQGAAFGGAGTDTRYVVIEYSSDFTGAANRRTGWVASAEDPIDSGRPLRAVNGKESVVLGLAGTGVANGGKKIYKVDILDSEEKIIVEYVFDLTPIIDAISASEDEDEEDVGA